MKNQIKVLNEIKIGNKTEYTIDELVASSDLTKRQVYNALADLKNRRLIIKKHNLKIQKKKNKKLLRESREKKVYILINDKIMPRINDLIEGEKHGN